ncbi:N-acetylmuramoyl-L-alanine amidase, partial [Glaesserella parasuis]|nr:N-acetylmuramoyl-L-alanine amidase [Glaesserella parasuis]
HRLLRELEAKYPNAKIYGHRDLSPDRNGDGTIAPNEWVKDCPCFDVWEWLDSEEIVNVGHLYA